MNLKRKTILTISALILFLGAVGYLTHIKNPEFDSEPLIPSVDKKDYNEALKFDSSKSKNNPNCPDAWYINKMPSFGKKSDFSDEYIVENGTRYDKFDKRWLEEVCNMEPQVVQ